MTFYLEGIDHCIQALSAGYLRPLQAQISKVKSRQPLIASICLRFIEPQNASGHQDNTADQH